MYTKRPNPLQRNLSRGIGVSCSRVKIFHIVATRHTNIQYCFDLKSNIILIKECSYREGAKCSRATRMQHIIVSLPTEPLNGQAITSIPSDGHRVIYGCQIHDTLGYSLAHGGTVGYLSRRCFPEGGYGAERTGPMSKSVFPSAKRLSSRTALLGI